MLTIHIKALLWDHIKAQLWDRIEAQLREVQLLAQRIRKEPVPLTV
jgi:hypothetical protein